MVITSGTIRLRSGNWHWQVLGGERVRWLHLVREGEPDQQMLRPLVSSAPVSDRSIRPLAVHPGTRVWIEGEQDDWWMVHDPAYLMRAGTGGHRMLTLVSAAGARFEIEVTESLEIGEMTDAELAELRDRALAGGAVAAAGGEPSETVTDVDAAPPAAPDADGFDAT